MSKSNPDNFPRSKHSRPVTVVNVSSETLSDETTSFDDETPYFGHGQLAHPHQIEQDLRAALLSINGVRFASLQVRQVCDGICITGRIQTETDAKIDMALIERIARKAGANKIYNRLETMHSSQKNDPCLAPRESASDLSSG